MQQHMYLHVMFLHSCCSLRLLNPLRALQLNTAVPACHGFGVCVAGTSGRGDEGGEYNPGHRSNDLLLLSA